MYKSFEQRKSAYLAVATEPRALSLADLLASVPAPSSEDRLLGLPQDSWTPTVFRNAARELFRHTGFTASLYTKGQPLPPLGSDVSFKYRSEYLSVSERAPTEDLTVAAVVEQERVIGFGIACCRETGCHIEIIDVDEYSRRSAGLELKIAVGAGMLGVGVGHVVVDSLVSTLSRPCFVDAANTDSRYVFKSLGFVPRGTGNLCLLELR